MEWLGVYSCKGSVLSEIPPVHIGLPDEMWFLYCSSIAWCYKYIMLKKRTIAAYKSAQ